MGVETSGDSDETPARVLRPLGGAEASADWVETLAIGAEIPAGGSRRPPTQSRSADAVETPDDGVETSADGVEPQPRVETPMVGAPPKVGARRWC